MSTGEGNAQGRPTLAPYHLELLAQSCIPPEYAAIRGYRTVYKDQGDYLRRLGFSDIAASHVPGLVIPLRDRAKKVWGAQFRPDVPYQVNGKTTKYVVRPGQGNRLDIPPTVADSDWLTDADVPLFIPEGVRKADSGAVMGLCTVGMLSVSGWKGSDTALADWWDIALKKRQVVIAYDSDVMRKKPVHREMQKLTEYLEYRRARVFYTHLPDCSAWHEDGSKTGLDDFFYDGYTVEDLWHYVKREPPELRTESVDGIEGQSSWTVVDLGSALSREPIAPGLGLREDDAALMYRGLVHWVYGAYESGKTWLCLHFVAQALLAGQTALYVDFEDSERGISSRLMQLGVPESTLKDTSLFAYIRPDEPLDRVEFEPTLSRSFDLAVLDGVTESMAQESLKDSIGGDVALWQAMLPKAVARRTGAAVLCIDHVPKDANNRVMPIGNQHKMSGLDGAAFKILRAEPFGKGNVGKALVKVSKDRPGSLRGIGIDYDPKDNTHVVGEFVLDAKSHPFEVASYVAVPSPGTYIKLSDSVRNTWCMEQLSRYLEGELAGELEEGQRTSNKVVEYVWDGVKDGAGKKVGRDKWRNALKCLCAENYALESPGSNNAQLYYVVQPYREADDPKSDAYVARKVSKSNQRKVTQLKIEKARKALEEANREIADIDDTEIK